MKRRLLILCTGNSARSQMAEGLVRHLAGNRFDVFSAGISPSRVNLLAIAAMKEIEIDISQHRSKHLNEFLEQAFDIVLTVCDEAAEACPVFPGKAERLHWSFPDPAAVNVSEAERLQSFRNVRDAFAAKFTDWLNTQSMN
jgi:arsenate reductase (thioredoxin)